ncbi:epoxide hydrolase 1 [Brachybacterium sp. NBEC-018]|uniref:epoxide hydrolase family protein n=1 Tax=Brachybacterium sp. NBEC-018 TaxID=2996004 RepID=UPI0021751813|nr:epoxide hydrolase [Brachybacterium sp. NBEC-018]UVY82402.1 epoxide hydrolase 1 [Brachybacterium sp. NBEC-018]
MQDHPQRTEDREEDEAQIRPFRLRASDQELADLHARLDAARLPERETVADGADGADGTDGADARSRWTQGVPLAELVDLVEHWRHGFDWRAFEARLDRLGQVVTRIDGLEIHALHRRSSRPDATPLLLTHGWPGSIVEHVHLIEELAEPSTEGAPAFHVVAPSLPGFGLSGRPDEPGWGIERIAHAWAELMRRLGHDRFLAHGGDWGGPITTILAGRHPERVIGAHLTWALGLPGHRPEVLDPVEARWAEETRRFDEERLAYAKVMQSSPQTLGYALVDSPLALLAWLLEKIAEWSDWTASPFDAVPRERVLENATLHWLTRTGASASRIYTESHARIDPELTVDVPVAITTYPRDIAKAPRVWAESRYHRIVRWAAPSRGGHFPSWEVPEAFVADLREGLADVLRAAG